MDSHITTPAEDEHDSAYSGLLVNDAHWAFGTDFEDPLAGVDTTIPEGVDAPTLAAYALMLGDDALVMSHRISEWTSNAPDLEDDIALSNIALDLLGQARLLLARAAKADESVVPVLPEGSPAPPEDAIAYFREAHQFRNVRLAELVNGDFADAVVRVLLFSVWRLATFERLRASRDHVLAAVAPRASRSWPTTATTRRGGSSPSPRAPTSPAAGCSPRSTRSGRCGPSCSTPTRSRRPLRGPASASTPPRSARPPRACSTRCSKQQTCPAPRRPDVPGCWAAPAATGCTARRSGGCSPRCSPWPVPTRWVSGEWSEADEPYDGARASRR